MKCNELLYCSKDFKHLFGFDFRWRIKFLDVFGTSQVNEKNKNPEKNQMNLKILTFSEADVKC